MQPTGFKYIVLVQISENLNQGGRADMISHWEDGDACVHELFYNVSLVAAARLWADEMTQDSIICTCISLAVRSSSV
ncbi:hypothetical protein SCLCIDRAFT_1208935 [Scleroderma citrinum Foug A]|uniref:Uncharacterized protein n=1 Tax=Scleroderma citrinum Foug A TaxID=1036808 RepID=A0A0C3E7I5_9AGAM|nr:hypothetical protein SCLCIDRAFT_1208935 [Scleroderma citrinum Foug A]